MLQETTDNQPLSNVPHAIRDEKKHKDEGYRILHVLRAPLGGAFRHVVDLANCQLERGLRVGLLCDESINDPSSLKKLDSLASSCELGVTRMRIPRRPSVYDVFSLRALRKKWASNPPDIIHGHGAKGSAYARVLAPALRAVSICTPHGGSLHFSFDSVSGAAYLSAEKILRARTGGMIFESEFAHREYEKKIGKLSFPYKIIRNGLHDAEFSPLQSENPEHDFVFVGEFRELKGVFVLLEAARALRARYDFKLLMVGSGPDEAKLRQRIHEYALEQNVSISAPVHPARAGFALGRFVVAPSIGESMPYIVLEALAACRPLLTTAVGGIPEIYGSRNDLLLAPGDPVMLSARMASFLDDPGAAAETAAELHAHARKHIRVAQMEGEVYDFYRTIEQLSACRQIALR